jgi:3-hydroxybutyryl-CoA dehydrogenase
MNDIVLIGDGPLAKETSDVFTERGWNVRALDQLDQPLSSSCAVVDTVTGPVEEKKRLLRRAVELVPNDAPIWTNTLYVTATQVASWVPHPERVGGFSPLMIKQMPLVEVGRPLQAEDDDVWARAVQLWRYVDKQVEVVGDEPGLVFPRTWAMLVNEAAFALTEGVAEADAIDLAMKKGTRFPMGPLEWADTIGVDQVVWILSGLVRELGEDRYRPAPLLRKMVYAGYTGRAAGRGFYRYDADGKRQSSEISKVSI